MNHQEVVEEDRRNKLPSNWEAKKARVEWEEKEEERKKVNYGTNLSIIQFHIMFNGYHLPHSKHT